MKFRWNEWNTEHIGDHGVRSEEAEYVVRDARAPFPEARDDDKWRVWGQSADGRFLQVVFVMDPDETIYVIHARPLTDKEKKQFRRRRK